MRRVLGMLVLFGCLASATPAAATPSQANAHERCTRTGQVRVTATYTIPLGNHAQHITMIVQHDGTKTVLERRFYGDDGELIRFLDLPSPTGAVSVTVATRATTYTRSFAPKMC